MNFRVLVWCWL